MSHIDPFAADGYSLTSMTRAINKLPNLYNRVAGLFPDEPISTTSFDLEQLNGSLNIVRSRPRGSAPDKVESDKRSMRSFRVPHFPTQDIVLPDDVQGVRAFGSENQAETVSNVILRKQQKMRNILDQTREYLAIGALQGIVYDADATVIYNLYNEFDIQAASAAGDVGKKYTLAFALTTDTTDIRGKCTAVRRHIEANLRGETMSGVHCLCGSTFFDNLVSHPQVEKVFLNQAAAFEAMGRDVRKGFRFGDIVFEEYAGKWTDHDGAARAGIAATSGICFPEGTGDTFVTVIAPGNFTDTVNTLGVPIYSRMSEINPGMNQGWKLWAESNVLPFCKRPEVLVPVTNT